MFIGVLLIAAKNWKQCRWPSISHQQIVINPCNGILFSNKKKRAFYISNNIYDSQNDYVEWKKPDKRVHTIWFYLANALGYTSSITVTWIRMVFAWKRETSKKEWLQQVKRTSLGAMDICSLSFQKNVYWSIVDLQCYVSFRCSAKWTIKYLYPLFF